MTIDIESKIIKKLEEQQKEEGSLPLLLKFYRELLLVQSGARERINIPSPVLDSETMKRRLAKRLPLLNFSVIDIDRALLRDLFAKVTVVFASYPELFGDIPEILKKPGTDRLITKKVVAAWFQGRKLPDTALTRAVNESLLQSIIHATLKPFLASYARALIGSVDQQRWRRRYCPICGGAPDFSYLDTETGVRWLVCSRCDTEWIFQRLECPYCGNKDGKTLAYFTDDEGLYRLYVCEHCKRYLKAIDLRKAEREVMMPLERFNTMAMDRQAQQQGYNPYN